MEADPRLLALSSFALAAALSLAHPWFGRPSNPPPSPMTDRIADAPLRACPDNHAPAPVPGTLELRMFHGSGIDPQRVREIESAARRYWAPHHLDIHVLGPSTELPYTSMFRGSFADLDRQADDPGILADTIYADLREFLRAHALPDRGAINVVVLRDIVHPSAAAAAVLGDLMGLTLAPELLRTGDPNSAAILTAIELGEDFEPTVLLSERHLANLEAEPFVAAVAHELGHALGLRHVDRSTNLMARERPSCLPDLDPAQLELLRAAL